MKRYFICTVFCSHVAVCSCLKATVISCLEQLFVFLIYFRFCVSNSPYFRLLTHFIFLIVSLRSSAGRVSLFYCFISPLF